MSDKYKAACREYAAAHAEIKHIAREIGQAFAECDHVQQLAWLKANPGKEIWAAPQFEHHLKAAYAMDRGPSDSGYGEDRYYANHDDDVEGYLAEVCPHCLAAHLAIQKRKAARKRFGIAKRRITVLGKAAA